MTKVDNQPVNSCTDSVITAETAKQAMDTGFREKLFSKLLIAKTDKDDIKSQLDACNISSNEGNGTTATAEIRSALQPPCLNCGKAFDPKANISGSCCYHSEVFTEWIYSGKNWKGEEVADLAQWTCCLKTHPLASGCKVRKHLGRKFKIREWRKYI